MGAKENRGTSAEEQASCTMAISVHSGEVAQESVLSQNWCSVGPGQQGKDQKHHERSLFPRNSVGVGGQESNYQRSTERETAECTGRFDSGGNHGIPQ